MKKLFNAFAVLALLFAAATSFGQTAPYIQGTIQTAPGSESIQNYTVGVGIESNTKFLLLDVNGNFNTANQVAGAGYSGILQGSGYYKFFNHILAGGGANLVVNTNGFNAKQFINTARESANPFVGGGISLGRFRSVATYQLPGKDGLLEQRFIAVTNQVVFTKHLAVIVPLGINSYVDGTSKLAKFGVGRVTVAQVGAGLKLSF